MDQNNQSALTAYNMPITEDSGAQRRNDDLAERRRQYYLNKYAPIKQANKAIRQARASTVLEQYQNGASTIDIAAAIGKHVKTVQRILKASGIPMKRGPRIRSGEHAAVQVTELVAEQQTN